MSRAKKNIIGLDSKIIAWSLVGAILLLTLFVMNFFGGISKDEVKLTIDFGDGNVRNFVTTAIGGKTAWDLLQQANAVYGIPLLVENHFAPKAIGGKENGQNGKRWNFYLNGRIRRESPYEARLYGGEKILFKFE